MRYASFQCLDCLLETIPNSIPSLSDFMRHLSNGITDSDYGIQMLTYGMLYKTAGIYGEKMTQFLDLLPVFLMKGIKGKLKEATKREYDNEGAKDVLIQACKALYALNQLPNINNARKFVTFYSRVEKTKVLIPMLNELKNASNN